WRSSVGCVANDATGACDLEWRIRRGSEPDRIRGTDRKRAGILGQFFRVRSIWTRDRAGFCDRRDGVSDGMRSQADGRSTAQLAFSARPACGRLRSDYAALARLMDQIADR